MPLNTKGSTDALSNIKSVCSICFGSLSTRDISFTLTVKTITDKGKSSRLLSLQNESIMSYRDLDPIVVTSSNRRNAGKSKFHNMTYVSPDGFNPLEITASMSRSIGTQRKKATRVASIVLSPNTQAPLVNVACLFPAGAGFASDFMTAFNGRAIVFYDDFDLVKALPSMPINWLNKHRNPKHIDHLFDIEEIKEGEAGNISVKTRTVYTTKGELEITEAKKTRRRNIRVRK